MRIIRGPVPVYLPLCVLWESRHRPAERWMSEVDISSRRSRNTCGQEDRLARAMTHTVRPASCRPPHQTASTPLPLPPGRSCSAPHILTKTEEATGPLVDSLLVPARWCVASAAVGRRCARPTRLARFRAQTTDDIDAANRRQGRPRISRRTTKSRALEDSGSAPAWVVCPVEVVTMSNDARQGRRQTEMSGRPVRFGGLQLGPLTTGAPARAGAADTHTRQLGLLMPPSAENRSCSRADLKPPSFPGSAVAPAHPTSTMPLGTRTLPEFGRKGQKTWGYGRCSWKGSVRTPYIPCIPTR